MTQIGLSALVVTVAVAALAASALGEPDHGVTGEIRDDTVSYVVPGSAAWRDGIRPGQRVIELGDAADPGGWGILTVDGEVDRGSFLADHLQVLRLLVWWAVPALILAAFVALLGFRRRVAAAALVPLTLAIAAQPLFAVGRAEVTAAAGAAVFAGGGLAAAAYAGPGRRLRVAAVVGVAVAGVFVLAIYVEPAWFDPLEAVRVPAAVVFAILGLTAATDRGRISEFLTGRHRPGFVDLAYLAAAVGLALALGIIGGVPLPLLIAGAVVALGVYPFWRRRTVATLDRLLSAPAREEAVIRAVESERGRLAREIHDAPLQDLTGVIRRLEATPGAAAEADTLRGVAAQLRGVATALHPPVLQDLGLTAALEDLAEQLDAARPDWRVQFMVDDLTNGARPPSDVELAAFRITQEATANAMAHSGGRVLTVSGAVAPDSVDLTVADDGAGIDPGLARSARRAGHFGLDSMRERARSVGATCSVDGDTGGASVKFRWERPA